jgi:NADPH:quinone reductase-like Zn-dependent oxidoreductase
MPFRAIWLNKELEVSFRSFDEKWKPEEGEVLVEVKYSGINPADIKHGTIGFCE